jgi:hypothetical protein
VRAPIYPFEEVLAILSLGIIEAQQGPFRDRRESAGRTSFAERGETKMLQDLAGTEISYALIAVLFVAGLVWLVSAHNSPAHKLSGPVFVSAAAAVIILVILKVINQM